MKGVKIVSTLGHFLRLSHFISSVFHSTISNSGDRFTMKGIGGQGYSKQEGWGNRENQKSIYPLYDFFSVFHHAYKVVVNDIELINLINLRNDQVLTRYKDQSIKIT